MYEGDQLISFETFSQKCNHHPSSLICYYALATALKNSLYSTAHSSSVPIQFRGQTLGALNRRTLYNIIKPKESPLCNLVWDRKFGIRLSPLCWHLIAKIKDSRLRVLSWKIIHNIYPTGVTLLKQQIRKSDICPHCTEDKTDTLEHFFVDCATVRPIWLEIRANILFHTGMLVDLSHQVILISPSLIPNIPRFQLLFVNQIIAIGKHCISKYKANNKVKLLELFQKELSVRKVWPESD